MVYTQTRKSFRIWELQDLVRFPIHTDKTLEHDRPDITVIDKKSEKCLLIDPACPFDTRIEKKEAESIKLQKFGKWER